MTADIRLGAISIDSTDPAGLAAFYRDLLDLEIMFESETFVALKGGGILMTTQKVDDHQPPSWPGGSIPKQMHLELAVDDLDATEARPSRSARPGPRRRTRMTSFEFSSTPLVTRSV